ncbi:hypothetical protein [Rhodococcus sp. RCBS9]|uniref:hypothetical protein n=1 Tax=Rhodococcus sp. RCBS9 TaxID=3031999 RepID=UPI0024028CFF|nr:hypothetical protein [Rhodococcus sp. RCBS9]WEX03823.1 hypothetical protein P0M12_30165 [Rhodococcus sp. RCBS9]
MNFLHAQVAPVIVQNIPPESSTWLTQPVATLIAASAAVIVACVTLYGVNRNQQQHVDKETVAAIERRRAEAVSALVEALEAGDHAWSTVGASHASYLGESDMIPPTAQDVENSLNRLRTVETKLQLLGLDESKSTKDLRDALYAIWRKIDQDLEPYPAFDPAWKAQAEMHSAYRRTVRGLNTKYDPKTDLVQLGLGGTDIPPQDN